MQTALMWSHLLPWELVIACRPGKGVPVHLSKRGAGFDVMKCLMHAEL